MLHKVFTIKMTVRPTNSHKNYTSVNVHKIFISIKWLIYLTNFMVHKTCLIFNKYLKSPISIHHIFSKSLRKHKNAIKITYLFKNVIEVNELLL